MSPSDKLTTCESCEVQHYDNCARCWGFGVHYVPGCELEDDMLPVRGGAVAENDVPENWQVCPHCGSTPLGMPGEAGPMKKKTPLENVFDYWERLGEEAGSFDPPVRIPVSYKTWKRLVGRQ